MIVKKDTNKEYHNSQGISASGLKSIYLTSVYDFNRRVYEDKPSFKLGTMVHEVILEPKEFEKNYYPISIKIDRRTKEGKSAWSEIEKEAEGRTLVSFEESQILSGIKQTLESSDPMSKVARKYLEGEPELSHYLTFDGIAVRVRPDLKGKDFISDIKTARFNSGGFGKKEFNSHVYSFAYHLQAAFYSDMLGIDPKNFKFIWVEPKPPYRIVVSTLNDNQIDQGREAYLSALEDWRIYLETANEKRFNENDLLFDGTLEL